MADARGHAFINKAIAGAESRHAYTHTGSPKRSSRRIANIQIRNNTSHKSTDLRISPEDSWCSRKTRKHWNSEAPTPTTANVANALPNPLPSPYTIGKLPET